MYQLKHELSAFVKRGLGLTEGHGARAELVHNADGMAAQAPGCHFMLTY